MRVTITLEGVIQEGRLPLLIREKTKRIPGFCILVASGMLTIGIVETNIQTEGMIRHGKNSLSDLDIGKYHLRRLLYLV